MSAGEVVFVTLYRCDICGLITSAKETTPNFNRRVHKWGPPEKYMPVARHETLLQGVMAFRTTQATPTTRSAATPKEAGS